MPTLEKSFENDIVRKSFSIQNFEENSKLYDVTKGSEFANFVFKRQEYRELFDWHAISEFN